jgi:hypothetical protein
VLGFALPQLGKSAHAELTRFAATGTDAHLEWVERVLAR